MELKHWVTLTIAILNAGMVLNALYNDNYVKAIFWLLLFGMILK